MSDLKGEERDNIPTITKQNLSSLTSDLFHRLIRFDDGFQTIKITIIDHLTIAGHQPDIDVDTTYTAILDYRERDLKFKRDIQRFQDARKTQQNAISYLLGKLSLSFLEEVKSHPDYLPSVIHSYDLNKFWTMLQTIAGSGGNAALHASIISLQKCVQKDMTLPVYINKMNTLRATLQHQFTLLPQEIQDRGFLSYYVDTLLILNLNKEKYSTIYTEITSKPYWGKFSDNADWLSRYDLSHTTLNAITNPEEEEQSGKTIAYHAPAKPINKASNNKNTVKQNYVCENCGAKGKHYKSDCPKPPSTCDLCGKERHMEIFCRSQDNKHKSSTSHTKNKLGSNKTQINKHKLFKMGAQAGIMYERERHSGKTKDASEEDDYISEDMMAMLLAQNYEGSDEEDNQGEWVPVTTARKARQQRIAQRKMMNANSNSDAIIDSGCTHRHIVTNTNLLNDICDTNIRVETAAGPDHIAKKEGTIPGIKGRAILLPEGHANLLSLMTLVEDGGKFVGNAKVLKIYDKRGALVLEAPANNGGWHVDLQDIVSNKNSNVLVNPKYLNINKKNGQIKFRNIKSFVAKLNFTAEEIRRAEEAGKLHYLLGHPSEAILLKTIERGLPNSNVTGRDLRNWYLLKGDCAVCLEAKMRAAPANKSENRMVYKTGEEVHSDILELEAPSISGNTHVLFSVDRRSTEVMPVLMKGKKAVTIAEAWKSVIAELNQYGHLVRRLVTDKEATLGAAGEMLKVLGVRHLASPAGRHATFAERYIQILKQVKRSIKASMIIEMIPELDGELTMAAAALMNKMIRSATNVSPEEMVTGVKAKAPKYAWGQVGLFHHKRQEEEYPAEWGMVVGWEKNGDEKALRAYIFSRKKIYSRYKFVPNDNVPMKELGLKPRVQFIGKRLTKREVTLTTVPTVPTVTSQPITQAPIQQQLTQSYAEQDTSTCKLPAQPQPHSPTLTEGQQNNLNKSLMPEALTPTVEITPTTVTESSVENDNRTTETNSTKRSTFTENLLKQMEKLGPPPKVAVPALPVKPQMFQANAKKSLKITGVVENSARTDMVLKSLMGKIKQQSKSKETSSQLLETDVGEEDEVAKVVEHNRLTRKMVQQYIENEYENSKNPWIAGREKLERLRKIRCYFARHPSVEHSEAITQIQAMRMSYKQAVDASGDRKAIDESIEKEVKDNIVPCGYAVSIDSIPASSKKGILNSFLFMKDKYLSNGEFERWKARLVVNGSQQCVENVGETYAPTVNTTSVMLLLQALADSANTGTDRELASWDIAGAFVTTKIPRDVAPIYVRMPKEVTAIWLKIKPEDRRHVHRTNGTMIIRLTHYLYGLRESPERFQTKLRNHLVANGLVQSKADPCVFTLWLNGHYSHIATHVDDLIGNLGPGAKQYMRNVLKKEFDITEQTKKISYLGMQIEHRNDGSVSLHQGGMTDKVLKRYTNETTKEYNTPAAMNLADRDATSELLQNPKTFRSPVMALMYLARMTRPDLLHTVSVLATRSASPTLHDRSKLERVFGYLKRTRNLGIRFTKGNKQIKIYADASHGLHPKGEGHGGIVITYGSAPIYAKSWKIKMITRSSSETELVALEESSTFPSWLRQLMNDMHLEINGKHIIHQDNKSTMLLASNGGSFGRTKHLIIKKSFVKQGLAKGEFAICYLPTKDMLADWFTKPMTAAEHLRFLKELKCGAQRKDK